jgi:glycosyltransferase involved in cell wall biosynthesis
MKPVLFVTGHAPAYRAGAFARLHERETIEVALFGGSSKHGGATATGELGFPHRRVHPRQLHAIAASGRYRAVVCPTGGRVAPLAAWTGARRGKVPVLLWASLWAHPRSVAHAFSYLPLRRMYASADAVVTYGPHVSAYVSARGARNVHVAPQSVDNDFWRSDDVSPPRAADWPAGADARFLFAGRAAPEKGEEVLLAAWRGAGPRLERAALILAGEGQTASHAPADSSRSVTSTAPVVRLGVLDAPRLRDVYAACDVLVVPSLATRTFREPWGLVVNEAMNQGLAVIASEAVGAAAGGLVRDRVNGLVVPAADAGALGAAIVLLASDPGLRGRLGAAGAGDVLAYNHDAWAEGFSQALSSLGVSRGHW